MKKIKIKELVGSFAENKDLARDIRINMLMPQLDKGAKVTIDFKGVDSVTQSFIHALISELIRKYGPEVLDSVLFKNCSDSVKGIIGIVVDYMQV